MAEEVVAEGWRATGGQDNAGGQSYGIDNSDGTIGMGYKPGKHYSSSPSTVEIKSEPKHPLHGKQVTNGKVTGRLMGTEHQGTVAKIKHSSGMIHHVDAKEIKKMKEEVEQIDEVAAWQRKEGKNPEGGLNRKGIESYRRENPGSKLSMAVTTKPSKLKPGSKAANRRKSFCARMSGMKKRLTSAKTANDPDSRINKSLRKWNC